MDQHDTESRIDSTFFLSILKLHLLYIYAGTAFIIDDIWQRQDSISHMPHASVDYIYRCQTDYKKVRVSWYIHLDVN